MRSVSERETVLQWSADNGTVSVWTSDPVEMRRWQRAGWPVKVSGYRTGLVGGKRQPVAWEARDLPRRVIAYRRATPLASRQAAAKRLNSGTKTATLPSISED